MHSFRHYVKLIYKSNSSIKRYIFLKVCLHCLTRIAASHTREAGTFRCPICREQITIPRGGVPALPPSFLVNQLLDLMSRQRREVCIKNIYFTFFNINNQQYSILINFYLLFRLFQNVLCMSIKNYYFVKLVMQFSVRFVLVEIMQVHHLDVLNIP